MTTTDLTALLPLLVTALAAVAALLVLCARRSHRLVATTALLGFAGALGTLPAAAAVAPHAVPPLLAIDGFALLYGGLVLAAGLAVTLMAFGYLEQRDENREELYVLLLVATTGALVLVAASHLVSLFLGLEILSVAIYALVAYLRRGRPAIEAGAKYLILAGASSAFLIFGMALLYTRTGTMELVTMASRLRASEGLGLALPGLALLVAGIGFKLALVPFHMATPDVYEGAPAPVTALVATVSKGSVLAVLLRVSGELGAVWSGPLALALSAIAIASMLAGNLLALLQDNVKRILAYSSIAHLGYLLVAFLASGELRARAVTFYLVAYFLTTLAAFGVLTVLSGKEREADRIEDYRGLYWRRPWLAALMTAALLSLAGIPLTAGFVGKLYVAAAGVQSALWVLVLVLVAGSAIGLYYYLRLLVVMFQEPAAGGAERWPAAARVPLGAAAMLAMLAVGLVWLGVYPAPLVRLIEASVGMR